MAEALLALNAGSSSLKFSLFERCGSVGLDRLASGEIEDLHTAPHFSLRDAGGLIVQQHSWPAPGPGFVAIVAAVLDSALARLETHRLLGIVHRVVHGGARYRQPQFVTPALIAALEPLIPLAPLHLPQDLAPMKAIQVMRPELLQIACFDTEFHATMPALACDCALPREYTRAGLRRQGFHGLSYEYIAGELRRLDALPARVIVAHLGSGASLCALQDGHSIDTTMGATPLDGLMMGTRCGSLDPGLLLALQQACGLDAAELVDLLYRRSGLLGVSGGIASDVRRLQASEAPEARQALELFAYRVARDSGAMASSLAGLDAYVFTGGIGEHAPAIRADIGRRLAWLGIDIDAAANASNAPIISTAQSRVQVRVIATDEARMLARHALALLQAAALAG